MAYVPNRDDPFLPSPSPSLEEMRRRDRIEGEFQADPEFAEGSASGMRVGLYAVAIPAVLGIVRRPERRTTRARPRVTRRFRQRANMA